MQNGLFLSLGLRVLANTTQVFFFCIPKHLLECRIQPKQLITQNCCYSSEIYFSIKLIVHMTFMNAFNAIIKFATFV